jgi:pre-mRNA 3'-end-processing factor FIP1
VIDSKSAGISKAPTYEEPQAQPKEVIVAPSVQVAGQPGVGQQQQQQPLAGEVKERPAGLDINSVAQYKGVPITHVNLEDLEDKPWRRPGADITDYFNFGFDEFTWTAYCSKQDNLRDTYTPQKLMSVSIVRDLVQKSGH